MIRFLILIQFYCSICFAQNTAWFVQRSQPGETIYSVNFINSQTGAASGADGLILKTTNGGSNWLQQNTNTTQVLESIILTSEDTGYAAGRGGIILKTIDGGNNWVIQSSGVTEDLKSIFMINNSLGYVAGNNMALLKTTNGGNNWFTLYVSDSLSFSSVFFINNFTGWVNAFTYPPRFPDKLRIYKTRDGGINWTLQYERSEEFSPLLSINFTDTLNGWTLVQLYVIGVSEVIRTTNGGESWNPYFISAGQFNSIHFLNEKNGWSVGGYNGPGNTGIRMTTNGGINWNNQYNPFAFLKSVFMFDTLTGWAVGFNGRIIKTTTGGLTNFTNNIHQLPDRYILYQNYPNPFNPVTNLEFAIPNSVFVSIKIYDVLGNEIITLLNERKPPGNYEVKFDASNYPSGIYFYTLEKDGNVIDTKRMMLLK